ncbi:VOC family protein [Neobacillus novalis]|uniref:VOC family protein n=1 Tax=Neobacillus novalis TaxID=220687 RepID=A0AA95MSF8_9BACI|nr:VOC family protein [Neobacillus novalis]WHY86496.1 VOC family protein [Neobacillus novalis]
MRVHHFGLEVNIMEESVAFYKKHLGFQEECRMFFLGEEIVFLALGDFRLELISGHLGNNKTTHICFEVSDLHEVMKRFDDIRKIEGPYKLENGWETVFFEGPEGEIIEFLELSSA